MDKSDEVVVNRQQCEKIGSTIKDLDIRASFYKREFLTFDSDRETKLRMYLISAAICHQTHQLHHKTLNLWGWDYMEYAFIKMLKERNPILNPGYLSICTSDDLKQHLQRAFSHDGNPENATLDRIEERIQMLIEICSRIKSQYKGSVSRMIDSCNGKLINNGQGIYEVLSQFHAFSDPHKKKITFFLKLATDAGILQIKDSHNLNPIMDYHMQRILLRTGCLEVMDQNLKGSLRNKLPLQSDESVRAGSMDAIRIVAEVSGHGLLKMNDFFWPIGRSCCNETTLCKDKHCMKDPCTFFSMVNIKSHKNCILEKDCYGSQNETYRGLWEPNVETNYY